jgi:hypothetical protein
VVDLKSNDLTLLNTLQQKMRIQHASLDLVSQDIDQKDSLSTIEGTLVVSLIEIKGLITAREVNRRQADFSRNVCDPVVEVRLEKKSNLLQGVQ